MDLITLALAKKYTDANVIAGGVTTGMLNSAISSEANSRNQQITQAITQEANNRQGQVNELNGEIRKADDQATLATSAIWGTSATETDPPKKGILNGPGGSGLITDLDKRIVKLEDASPEGGASAMKLINNAVGGMVLVADENGQATETDIPADNVSLRSDGFIMRLSRPGVINIPPGVNAELLSGFNIQDNVTLSANTNLTDWSMNGVALVFPAFDGYTDYFIDVRLYGDVGGGAVQVREFTVQLVRMLAGTVAQERGIVKVQNTSLSANSVNFSTYTLNTSDPFIDGGVRVVLNNTSGEQITISQVDVVIKGVRY